MTVLGSIIKVSKNTSELWHNIYVRGVGRWNLENIFLFFDESKICGSKVEVGRTGELETDWPGKMRAPGLRPTPGQAATRQDWDQSLHQTCSKLHHVSSQVILEASESDLGNQF